MASDELASGEAEDRGYRSGHGGVDHVVHGLGDEWRWGCWEGLEEVGADVGLHGGPMGLAVRCGGGGLVQGVVGRGEREAEVAGERSGDEGEFGVGADEVREC